MLLFFTGQTDAQVINKKPLSSRQTNYTIDASLNTESKTVTGSMQAYWVNLSSDTVPDIQLHLYMNAFRDKNSTLNREMGIHDAVKENEAGSITIIKLSDQSGNNLLPSLKFICPDDGNILDQTVADITLPEPVMPGDTIRIIADFETRLPVLSRRTGFNGNFYFIAQWFPKFGVYENAGMRYATKGAWNCHQFHANSEFYSNHSLYNVKITVPKKFVVGSGGLL